MNHQLFEFHVQHNADQHALKYLEDVWVERDKQEPRCYTIEFVGSLMYLLVRPNAGVLLVLQRKSILYRQCIEERVQVCPSSLGCR